MILIHASLLSSKWFHQFLVKYLTEEFDFENFDCSINNPLIRKSVVYMGCWLLFIKYDKKALDFKKKPYYSNTLLYNTHEFNFKR